MITPNIERVLGLLKEYGFRNTWGGGAPATNPLRTVASDRCTYCPLAFLAYKEGIMNPLNSAAFDGEYDELLSLDPLERKLIVYAADGWHAETRAVKEIRDRLLELG